MELLRILWRMALAYYCAWRGWCRHCGKPIKWHYGEAQLCEPPAPDPPRPMRRFRSEVRPELTWIGRPSIYGQLEDEEYRRQKILDDEKKRQKEESDK